VRVPPRSAIDGEKMSVPTTISRMKSPAPCARTSARSIGSAWPVRRNAPISTSAAVRKGAMMGIEMFAARYATAASSRKRRHTATTSGR
jgi:hypothetical protein